MVENIPAAILANRMKCAPIKISIENHSLFFNKKVQNLIQPSDRTPSAITNPKCFRPLSIILHHFLGLDVDSFSTDMSIHDLQLVGLQP